MLNSFELTGRAATHVQEAPELACTLHPDALSAFRNMRAAAATQGIDLFAVSSFRDLSRQTIIWNAKFRGERPLLDRAGLPLERSDLDVDATIDAILLWSALPGASRHHWGTDLDVADRAALPAGYRAQLLPQEFAPGGVFERLEAWLANHAHSFGFFRPYRTDRGGVQPEHWHLSWAPLAVPALEALSPGVLRAALLESEIDGLERVLERLPELHARFVHAVDGPPAAIWTRPS